MAEKRNIDWPRVDWSKSNTAIARALGCSHQNVSHMRKKHGRKPEEKTTPEEESLTDGDRSASGKSQGYAHSIAAATARANPEKVAEITALIGKMYKAVDVAAALGVTVRAVQGYLKRGLMGGRKIGGDWIVTEENLKRFVEGLPPKG